MARVTVYDVAEKAGVSTATVSFAFRHPDKVKDDTKAKVLRVAEELGYVPSGNARSLAKGRTGTLGMYAFDMLLERPQGSNLEDDWPDVSPRSIDEPLDGDEPNVLVYPLYVDEVLRGFELECWKSGKGMLMGAASKKNDHRSVTDIAGRVDGLALMPSGYNDTLPLSMLAKTIPLVMVGVGDEKLPAAYLQCDNASDRLSTILSKSTISTIWHSSVVSMVERARGVPTLMTSSRAMTRLKNTSRNAG